MTPFWINIWTISFVDLFKVYLEITQVNKLDVPKNLNVFAEKSKFKFSAQIINIRLNLDYPRLLYRHFTQKSLTIPRNHSVHTPWFIILTFKC